jgi:peptide/nickel transport system permease protein
VSYLIAVSAKFIRFIVVMGLVVLGSTALVRYAPGYLSDARELDARYAAGARAELANEASRSTSLWSMVASEIRGALRGEFGTSRQYDMPVRSLMAARLPVTANLLIRSVFSAWILSLGLSLWITLRPRAALVWHLPATILLALPTSVLATISLLNDTGGPVLVLTLILGARDFALLERTLRQSFNDPHVLQARAQGIRWHRVVVMYVAPAVAPQLAAVAGLSIVTALGAIIPVEVLFGVAGVGQLAWNAAMNRDLPVLLAVTALMALVMASLTAVLGEMPAQRQEAA